MDIASLNFSTAFPNLETIEMNGNYLHGTIDFTNFPGTLKKIKIH